MIDNENEWIGSFWDLYTANDLTQFKMALELKQEHLPRSLFRYRSLKSQEKGIERITSEISSGSLRLVKRTFFNDVFDTKSLLHNNEYTKYLNNTHITPEQNQYMDILNQAIMPEIEKINDEVNKCACAMQRIACFTDSPTNTMMWGQYAGNNSGVCLEYDTTHVDEFIKDRLFPVIYQDRSFDAVSFLKNNIGNKTKLTILFDYMTCLKTKQWQEEKEWRLIINPMHYGKPRSALNEDELLIKFPLPKRVILGSEIQISDKKIISDICKNNNIELGQVVITSYRMNIEEIIL